MGGDRVGVPSGPRNPHVSITASHRHAALRDRTGRRGIEQRILAAAAARRLHDPALVAADGRDRRDWRRIRDGRSRVALQVYARPLSLSLWANPLCRATSRRTAACAMRRTMAKALNLRVPFFITGTLQARRAVRGTLPALRRARSCSRSTSRSSRPCPALRSPARSAVAAWISRSRSRSRLPSTAHGRMLTVRPRALDPSPSRGPSSPPRLIDGVCVVLCRQPARG